MRVGIDKEFERHIWPLSQEEAEILEASIRERGCLDSIKTWRGLIVDGHNRFHICKRHGITFKTHEIDFSDREEALDFIDKNQAGRRNLDPDRRAIVIGRIYNRRKKRHGGTGANQYKQSVHREHSAGKERAQVAAEFNVSQATVERSGKLAAAFDAVAASPESKSMSNAEILAKAKSIKKERAAAKKEERRKKIAQAVAENHPLRGKLFELKVAGIESVNLTNKADAIITDPPYGKDYVELYSKLAQFAASNLKDGGHLLVMTGQANLPEIIAAMNVDGISYQWTLCYLTPGKSMQVFGRDVKSNWKPVLWYIKGKHHLGLNIPDTIRSEAPERYQHDWQQSESGFAKMIELFTEENQLVCDPFCGSGTTGVVAVRMNRLFFGSDIEAKHIASAAKRIGA